MKKKEFLTESKRKAIIADKEKAILESFAKTFNKIKRIDENEINEIGSMSNYEGNRGDDYKYDGSESNQEWQPFYDDIAAQGWSWDDESYTIGTKCCEYTVEFYQNNLYGLYRDNQYGHKGERLTKTGLNIDELISLIHNIESTNQLDENGEDYEAPSRGVEHGINPYQKQPDLSDLGQLTPKQEQMKEYISNYVNSELELNHEMSNYIKLGYQGLSDTVKKGLRNDMDYQTWVQMSHDEETFRRERGGIDENKYGGDSPYFKTLSQALDFVREYATKLGYEVDENDIFFQFGTGGVGYEQTKSANIGLLKNGKELNRFIHVSIYRMPSGKYELTMYKTF